MTDSVPRPASDPTAPSSAHWSAGDESEVEFTNQLTAPPSERTWNPGPPPAPLSAGGVPPYEPTLTPPPPAYRGVVVVNRGTNGLAIASLICGICGWTVVPFLGALLAIILGHVARAQIRHSGEQGGGMAMAGLILGYLSLVATLLGTALVILFLVGVLAATSASGGG